MNGALLQQRIYAGTGKAAKKVGEVHMHFRSATPLNPLDPANLLDPINVVFSTLTRPFKAYAKWSDETWIAHADGRLLQPRDFLVGPGGTFYVGDMQPLLPIQAVRCTHTAARIERPIYVTGSLQQGSELIASGLPFGLKLKSVNVKIPIGAANTAGVGISNWLAFIPMAETTLKRNDLITDTEGVQYEVDAPAWTPMGYVAQVRLANP